MNGRRNIQICYLVTVHLSKLELICIPSHCNIDDIEESDKLAREGPALIMTGLQLAVGALLLWLDEARYMKDISRDGGHTRIVERRAHFSQV